MKWAKLTKPITRAGLFITDSCGVAPDKCSSRSAAVKLRCTSPSFRDAPLGAGPESILTVAVMDSGLPLRGPRNDRAIAAPLRLPRSPPAPLFRPAGPPAPAPSPDNARQKSRDRSGPAPSGLQDILRYRRHTR